MGKIIVVSPQVEKWADFIAELGKQCQMEVIEARAGNEAMNAARANPPVAMIVDQELGDMAGISLVRELLQINAMINMALVSDQSEAFFHDETEGLGLLMQLPPIPDAPTAVQFSKLLKRIIV